MRHWNKQTNLIVLGTAFIRGWLNWHYRCKNSVVHASRMGSTQRFPVPMSLHLLTLQLKPSLSGSRARKLPLFIPCILVLIQRKQGIRVQTISSSAWLEDAQSTAQPWHTFKPFKPTGLLQSCYSTHLESMRPGRCVWKSIVRWTYKCLTKGWTFMQFYGSIKYWLN